MTHQIIIDTDPGQDDAVAILLALASPEIEILGITAVAGNVPLSLTEVNARKICELAGRSDIKVYSGAIRPMLRNLGDRRTCAWPHRTRWTRFTRPHHAAAKATRGGLHR